MSTNNPQSKPANLTVVLLITFLLSVGTGSVTLGLFFIAKAACGFSRPSQFLLGITLGAVYIPSALAAGAIVRKLESARTPVSSRTLLLALVIAGGIAALVPPVLFALGQDPCWAIWLVAASYGITTGVMWPLVESYLAGGRKHKALLSATGRFNIVWTVAVTLAMLLLAPFLKAAPLQFFFVLAGIHAVSAAAVLMLPSTPAKHLEITDPHPPIYESQLALARRLLPLSYLLISVLSPYFPGALTRLGVELHLQPIFVCVWMLARVLTMASLERWHGWHGKPATLTVAAVLVAIGFTATAAAPLIQSIPMLIAALAVFGVGVGITYTAALYYVLEVGEQGAQAGGSHEALIGIGYTVGPAIGLVAALAAQQGLIPDSQFDIAIIAVAATVCTLGFALTRQAKQK